MKGYKESRKFEEGICFICGKPCEAYCHLECSLAYAEEKNRRLEEAKLKEKK